MTEHDLATALDRISASVQSHRVELGEKIATLTANVGTLQTSHEANAGKLDEVLRLELSCPARAGWDGLGRELGEVKKKISENRISVDSELRFMRGDATGAQEIGGRRWTDTRGTLFRTIALKALPYVLLACIALGAYLVSGGDTEATARALRAVSDAVARVDSKIEKVEAKVDDVADDTGATAEVSR